MTVFFSKAKRYKPKNKVVVLPKKLMPEESLHITCVDYLRKCCPDVLVQHAANEAKWFGILRSFLPENAVSYSIRGVFNKLYKMGFCKGWPDLSLYWRGGGSLHIEFKANGGTLQPEQKQIIKTIRDFGHSAEVVYSFDEFKEFLLLHGVPTREAQWPTDLSQPSAYRVVPSRYSSSTGGDE